MTPREPAPAKVNLCLHVTGRRADGYHLLDSLVVFTEMGDRLSLRPLAGLSLSIAGPEAKGLTAGSDNLVLRAARLMGASDLALTLDKRLPLASGIGGGSSDAAACLRLLMRETGAPCPGPAAILSLGADVPVCLDPRPARMRGIGERLDPVPPLPPLWMVLVNPRVEVPTPQVFKALGAPDNPPLPDILPEWPDASAFLDWLAMQRNDLQAPAIAIAPVIATVLDAISAAPDCALARMSGSGATCFGLFAREAAAQTAARAIAEEHPGWWCVATALRAAPDQ